MSTVCPPSLSFRWWGGCEASDQAVTLAHEASAAVIGVVSRALHPQPGITVDLNDLGRYLVRQRLLAEGAKAHLTGQGDEVE